MTSENYILYLKGTVDGYSSKVKRKINRLFISGGVQFEKKLDEDSFDDSKTYSSDEERLTNQIKYCLENDMNAVKLFENWEFEKDYKYSILFETKNSNFFNDVDFQTLFPKGTVSTIESIDDSDEYFTYFNDECFIVKFSRAFSAYDTFNNEEMLVKYPMLVVFHKNDKIVEIRFDGLKRQFISDKKAQTIYIDLVSDILEILKLKFGIELNAMDLDFIINTVRSSNDKSVKLMAEYKNLPSGGNAQLDVGKNRDYVMPIIGELKELIEKHRSDIEKIPLLNEDLNQFLFENEELSDYEWIQVVWENEIKTRNIKVKFIFDYHQQGYCLLQHMYSDVLVGMERMNFVTKYISKNRSVD